MTPRSPLVAGLFANRLFAPLIIAMMVAATLVNAWLYAHPELLRVRGITDYQDFYVAGKLALNGRAECAYTWECLRQAQLDEFGAWEYMPWAYPPQFTGLVAGFAVMPHAVSFAVFVLGTFALFVLAIFLLAGRHAAFALAMTVPAILINVRSGQNGFLTAGLLGIFAWGFLRRRSLGGLALGAMIVKPHLAVAAALAVMLRRRWGMAVCAGLTVAGSILAATAGFGPGIWAAFREGSASSAMLLWDGEFPIERMTSVFALAYQMGAPAGAAMAVHCVVAVGVVGGLGAALLRRKDERLVMAAVAAGSVLISPYSYDYDLTILSIALALVAQGIVDRISGPEALLLGVLSWLSAANFAVIMLALGYVSGVDHHKQVWSLSALCVFGGIALVAVVLRRPVQVGHTVQVGQGAGDGAADSLTWTAQSIAH